MKKLKALLALSALVAVLAFSAVAQAETVTVSMTIDGVNSLDLDCDNDGIYDEVGVDDAEALVQPATGTNPGSNPVAAADESYAAGNCQMRVKSNSTDWEISLTKDDLLNTATDSIPDVGADCVLENAIDPHPVTEEEFGFRLENVGAAISGFVTSDTGCTVAKPYNQVTAASDMHDIPTTATTILPLDNGTAVDNTTFEAAYGAGITTATEAGSYDVVTTWTLVPL